jgi:hypothetical protein
MDRVLASALAGHTGAPAGQYRLKTGTYNRAPRMACNCCFSEFFSHFITLQPWPVSFVHSGPPAEPTPRSGSGCSTWGRRQASARLVAPLSPCLLPMPLGPNHEAEGGDDRSSSTRICLREKQVLCSPARLRDWVGMPSQFYLCAPVDSVAPQAACTSSDCFRHPSGVFRAGPPLSHRSMLAACDLC